MRDWFLWRLPLAFAVVLGFAVMALLPPSELRALDVPRRLSGPPCLPLDALALLLAGGLALGFSLAFAPAPLWWRWLQPLLVAALAMAPLVVRYGSAGAADVLADPTSHNLWPFEFVVLAGPGLLAALAGAYAGAGMAWLLPLRKANHGLHR